MKINLSLILTSDLETLPTICLPWERRCQKRNLLEKILKSLSKKFDMKVTAIEEA